MSHELKQCKTCPKMTKFAYCWTCKDEHMHPCEECGKAIELKWDVCYSCRQEKKAPPKKATGNNWVACGCGKYHLPQYNQCYQCLLDLQARNAGACMK